MINPPAALESVQGLSAGYLVSYKYRLFFLPCLDYKYKFWSFIIEDCFDSEKYISLKNKKQPNKLSCFNR